MGLCLSAIVRILPRLSPLIVHLVAGRGPLLFREDPLAACIPPTTRSPGHLAWYYLYNGNKHQFSMRLIDGVDIYTAGPLVAEADRIARKWQAAVTGNFTCDEMSIKDPDGRVVYAAGIGPYVGTLSAPIGSQLWRSNTVRLQGRGNVNVPGQCAGPEHTVFMVGDSVTFVPGEKYMDTGLITEWADLVTAFNTSLYGPADFFGQQVDYQGFAPIQWNSTYQKKYGA